MVYLKSVLVALAGMVAAAVLTLVAVVIITLARAPRIPGATVGFDPVSIFRSFPVMWLAPLAGFAGGFLWNYSRLRKKRSAPKA